MNYVALIPARGASKRIPRKMMKLFKGRPLIEYALGAALESKKVERVVLSTEDDEIKKYVANIKGVEVFHRSIESTVEPNVPFIHLREFFQSNSPDAVVMLQATSPFTTGEDIDKAIELFESLPAKITASLSRDGFSNAPYSVFSGVKLKRYFYRPMMDGSVAGATEEEYYRPGLDKIKGLFVENGALYVFRRRDFLASGRIMNGFVACYEMPIKNFFELDTEDDWRLLECV